VYHIVDPPSALNLFWLLHHRYIMSSRRPQESKVEVEIFIYSERPLVARICYTSWTSCGRCLVDPDQQTRNFVTHFDTLVQACTELYGTVQKGTFLYKFAQGPTSTTSLLGPRVLLKIESVIEMLRVAPRASYCAITAITIVGSQCTLSSISPGGLAY
jgi:hypothetical protein